MIFAPDYGKAWIALGFALPFSLLIFAVGFWIASRLVGAKRSWGRVAGAVAAQWALVVPLQLIFGWLLSLCYAEAADLLWLGVLALAVPVAAGLADYLVLRHTKSQLLVVSAVSSGLGMTLTLAMFFVLLKLL